MLRTCWFIMTTSSYLCWILKWVFDAVWVCNCRDVDDENQLIGQRHIGTMPRGALTAIMTETPADYDQVSDPTDFSNPLFYQLEEEEKQDLGSDSFTNYDDA